MNSSRRQLLQAGLGSAAALALGHSLPNLTFATPPLTGDNILVVIQLSGGNDGLNTIIPTRSDEYRMARPDIAVTAGWHRLTDDLAFNPGLKAFKELFDQGRLAVINGCGYPRPSRSHFRSLEIWHTAEPAKAKPDGWLAGAGVKAVNIGPRLPQALVSCEAAARCAQSIEDFGGRPYLTDASYAPGLGKQLELIARLIDAGTDTRVFYCQLTGFDTHANQLGQHQNQLTQLSEAVAAFQGDLSAKGNADRVAVMCFSEFGRRVVQNSSGGTDHGTAGPMFVVGDKVNGGVYGAHPSLADLDDGDLKYTTDFRRVYATVLDKWLDVSSPDVLGNRFEPLAFF
jgi:uncharacterized protein (DUF1501 family)